MTVDGSTRIISTTTQPLTLAEAKLHLRVDGSEEDALIESLIAVAADLAGQNTGRSIAASEFELRLDSFPDDKIRLLWPPILSVTSVTYKDAYGATQTLSPSDYVLDAHSEPGRLISASSWPATYQTANAVVIRYTAGYGASCPEAIKNWCLLQIGHWYRNRESVNVVNITSKLDYVDSLLDRYRVY